MLAFQSHLQSCGITPYPRQPSTGVTDRPFLFSCFYPAFEYRFTSAGSTCLTFAETSQKVCFDSVQSQLDSFPFDFGKSQNNNNSSRQQFEAKGQLGGGIRGNADADAKVSADEAFGTRLSRALLAALLVAGDAAAASAAAALIGALRG